MMSNAKLFQEKISFNSLESIFTRRTDAISPRVMQNVFGEIPNVKETLDIFSEGRLRELHKNKLCIIAFLPKTTEEIVDLFERKSHVTLFERENWQEDEPFWNKEKPREGLCLMSLGRLPGSDGKNYLEQTELLFSFLESLFPEIRYNSLWREEKEKFSLVETMDYLKTDEFFSLKGGWNSLLRPKVCELVQQMIVYNHENNYLVNELHGVSTSSYLQNQNEREYLLDISYFGGERIRVNRSYYTSHAYYGSGCPFICGIDWLKLIIG